MRGPRFARPGTRPLIAFLFPFFLSLLGCNGRHGASAPTGEAKQGAGLETSFSEPELIVPGVPMPVRLAISGRPGTEVDVRWTATEGVDLSLERSSVKLDERGAGVVELDATVPRADGCYIVAHLATPDGRTQEAHCLVGGAPDEKGSEPVELPDGRRVRIDPSR